jgi:hypothetical protein
MFKKNINIKKGCSIIKYKELYLRIKVLNKKLIKSKKNKKN